MNIVGKYTIYFWSVSRRVLFFQTTYVYCVYRAMSKSSKQLRSVLLVEETGVPGENHRNVCHGL